MSKFSIKLIFIKEIIKEVPIIIDESLAGFIVVPIALFACIYLLVTTRSLRLRIAKRFYWASFDFDKINQVEIMLICDLYKILSNQYNVKLILFDNTTAIMVRKKHNNIKPTVCFEKNNFCIYKNIWYNTEFNCVSINNPKYVEEIITTLEGIYAS